MDNKEYYGFKFVFHPIYQPVEGKICGYECLLRLSNELVGEISATEIMPAIAGDDDLLISLGNWTFKELFRVAKFLEDNNQNVEILSINIDTNDFMRESFCPDVELGILKSGLNPKNIYFEFKSEVINYFATVNKKFKKLRDMGIKVAIDNLGEDIYQLKNLRNANVDLIKIDKAYISTMLSDKRSMQVVEGIAEYALVNDINLIAMGVEDKLVEEELPKLGCFKMQGYYYSKPLSLNNLK